MCFAPTVFTQFLSMIPRPFFQKQAAQHRPGRSPRTLSHWDHFVHLLYIQFAGRSSLRDGLVGMKVNASKLYHLGVQRVAARSTLADANNSRSFQLFEAIAGFVYQRFLSIQPQRASKIFSFDSTTIRLAFSLFPWADYKQKQRGVKIHTLLDHNGHVPAVMCVTEARKHDSRMSSALSLPAGSMLLVDRGYVDLAWFISLTQRGICFVTRLKKNMTYTVVTYHPVSAENITLDQEIQMHNVRNPQKLRRIGYVDLKTGKYYEFLTNNFILPAEEIALLYKSRWEIEKFFRWIKQNLKIKNFVGRSENAVKSQIYIAMISFIMLKLMHQLNAPSIMIQEFKQAIQVSIFCILDLSEIFKDKKLKKKKDFRLLKLMLQAAA